MYRVIALMLCFLFPAAVFAADDNSYKVMYDGGTVQQVKVGKEVKLFIDPKDVRIEKEDRAGEYSCSVDY